MTLPLLVGCGPAAPIGLKSREPAVMSPAPGASAGGSTYVTTWSFRVVADVSDQSGGLVGRVEARTYTADTVPREIRMGPWTCEYRPVATTPDALVESGFSCRTSDADFVFAAMCASTRVDADIASVSLGSAKSGPAGVALVVQCETHTVPAPRTRSASPPNR
jgi:hypothetical protein